MLVQELSYQKEPEVLATAYITEDSIKSAEEYFNKKQLIKGFTNATYVKTELGEVVEGWQKAYHTFLIQNSTFNSESVKNVKNTFTVASSTYLIYGTGTKNIDGNMVNINTNYSDLSLNLTDEERENFTESKTTITSYSCHKTHYKDVQQTDIENIITK